MLTQCCNILLCIFKHPIVVVYFWIWNGPLYVIYYQSIMYYMSNIICFPLFFHIYQIHTKHLPRSRRIIFYGLSIVENATNRLYEWTYTVFHWSLPNCSNFIDVLQTFKYYDSARILNRNIYYVYNKIRIKIIIYK